MNIKFRQVSSLDKIFKENKREVTEIETVRVLKGERFSYQLEIISDESKSADVTVESVLSEYVSIYRVGNVNCDMPTCISRAPQGVDDDYLLTEPALVPDILEKIENNRIRISQNGYVLWIRVDIPKSIEMGTYDINICITDKEGCTESKKMVLEVQELVLGDAEMLYTEWLHADCIASIYDTEIYSEKHWKLIESFIETAADNGINMLLTPVHNPPIDTAVNVQRPNVQLVDITKNGDLYKFDFSRFERWIEICKKYGICHYEIPHLFSQWGSASAPNIYVGGALQFNCNDVCDSEEYMDFLKQYLEALIGELKRLGIYDNCYFHISDEPEIEHVKDYGKCADMVAEFGGDLKIIDALSNIEFYKLGLVKIPVPPSSSIELFLNEDIPERWVYYCCGQGNKVSNRFIAMSSYRNRIMGIQMYKFNIHGFLQWGLNFYYSNKSEYVINPYVTTSADYAFPSGDAFSVYPGRSGAVPSIRLFVFYEALQDVGLLKMLEKETSHEYVCNIIDELAGKDVRFEDAPEDERYIFKLRERIIDELIALSV